MDGYRQHIIAGMREIAIEFFATFSRFEFALKRGGFLAGQIDRKADIDWSGFANALGSDFFLAMKASPDAEIFFKNPPKVLKPGGLWRPLFSCWTRQSLSARTMCIAAACLPCSHLHDWLLTSNNPTIV